MAKTPSHNYNMPSEGTLDWNIPLNDNFEQLDSDIEIRALEENKGEYEPKEGTKYEATDSGAVYYGNGTAWVLADRKVKKLESGSSVTGEHLKAGNSSTAVVAPSVSSAFDSIQKAIDEGFRDIILAEEITEAGITIPKVPKDERQGEGYDPTDRFRLSGVGAGQFQTINDPGTHEAVIRAEDFTDRVLIENIFFDRKASDPGFCILAAKDIENPNTRNALSSNWIVRDVVSRAGPIALDGFRNLLINVDIANWSDRLFPIIGKADNETGEQLYDRYAGLFSGATFGMFGGTLSSKKASRSAAYIKSGAWSITGGVSFTNAREFRNDYYTNNVCFCDSGRGFMGGMSTEGDSGRDNHYDVQFGLEDSGDGPGNSVGATTFLGTSAFNTLNIQTQARNVRIQPFTDMTIKKDAPARIQVISPHDVTVEDGSYLPHEITHINPLEDGVYRVGGNRNSPQTTFGLKIHESKPDFPKEATFAVADGSNWDPTGSGNAALVAYDTDGNWKPIFEYSTSF
ncbi:hypothetical protein ABNG02_16450 [Halorubrum ejinorense]